MFKTIRSLVCSLTLLVVVLGAAQAQEYDPLVRAQLDYAPVKLTPYVSEDTFLYVEPTVRAFHARLREVERITQGRGLEIHHTFQYLYGSGFLPRNPVGNDLDLAYGIHLGRVRLKADHPEEAAEQILSRAEQYLQVIWNVFRQQEAPEMSVLTFRLLGDDQFKNRDGLKTRLTASFADVARGAPHVVIVDGLYGARVPAVLSPDESYLYETTRMELFCSEYRSTDWMYAGVRGFQVMFHFYCDLEIEDLSGKVTVKKDFPLHPTFMPTGRILKLEHNPLGKVPVDLESAGFLARHDFLDPERLAHHRLDEAVHLMSQVDYNLGNGDSLKALKRLYQAADAVRPALPADVVEGIRLAAGDALSNRDTQLCNELKTLSETAGKLFGQRAGLLPEYIDSFVLPRQMIQIQIDLGRLDARHPGRWTAEVEQLAQRGQDVQALVKQDEFPGQEIREQAAGFYGDVEDFAGRAMGSFIPSQEEVQRLRNEVAQRLERAGLASVPVYGLSDGTFGVLEADLPAWLAQADDLTAAARQGGAPPFSYARIENDQIPLDRRGNLVGPSDLLMIRDTQRDGEFRHLVDLIAGERFEIPTAVDSMELRRQARERFLQRFGSRGGVAWDQTRTGGDGLIALLGVAESELADRLLDRHLELTARADRAATAIPPVGQDAGPQVALSRALRTVSERILGSTAVHRTSDGRRGLTPEEALEAQRRLAELIDVLEQMAGGDVQVLKTEQNPLGGTELRLASGARLLIRPDRTERAQARLSLEPGGVADPLQLRLDRSNPIGISYDLEFGDPRTDWAVHGTLPTNPFVADHHFLDGMPQDWRRPDDPRQRRNQAISFSGYLEQVLAGFLQR